MVHIQIFVCLFVSVFMLFPLWSLFLFLVQQVHFLTSLQCSILIRLMSAFLSTNDLVRPRCPGNFDLSTVVSILSNKIRNDKKERKKKIKLFLFRFLFQQENCCVFIHLDVSIKNYLVITISRRMSIERWTFCPVDALVSIYGKRNLSATLRARASLITRKCSKSLLLPINMISGSSQYACVYGEKMKRKKKFNKHEHVQSTLSIDWWRVLRERKRKKNKLYIQKSIYLQLFHPINNFQEWLFIC